jgi:hypothetical protein
MVYQKDDPSFEDCGLRFREVDEGRFECPKCKSIIIVVDQDDCENGMDRLGDEKVASEGKCNE